MTVFILGAGCTYGTLSKRATCPPLAKDFGKSLSRKKYPSLVDVASHLGKDLKKLGLEEIWTYIDFYTKFTENRGGFLRDQEWLTGGAVCELKRAILSIYGHQWPVVVEAVRDADIVVVAGYSFPREDHHGRFLFKEGVRQRCKPLRKVEYYNVNSDSECAIREIFGSCKVVPKGPVTPTRRNLALRESAEGRPR